MAKEKYSGEIKEDEIFSGDMDKKFESKSMIKTFMLSNRMNATRELYVGRRFFRFAPYENKTCDEAGREIDEGIINHPDFIQQQEYFSYKEVK